MIVVIPTDMKGVGATNKGYFADLDDNVVGVGATNKGYIADLDEHVVVIELCRTEDIDDKNKKIAEEGEENVAIDDEEDDPWKISTVYVKVVPWKELSTCGKVKRVVWDYFGKLVLLVGFLYLFICSLDFLSNAFRLIGGRAAGSVFQQSELLGNPVAGLMIGIIATVLFQSSSTTTSIVVSMVAASIIPVQNAIPMVMSANIGTSVTNTLVSIGQITSKNNFRRAFAGATVHDMFNWLTVFVLLPLESATGYLFRLSDAIVNSMHLKTNVAADREFLKYITHPFTKLIIQVDKNVIKSIAQNKPGSENVSIVKHCCLKEEVDVTRVNVSDTWNFTYTDTEEVCVEQCRYLFESVANKWSDATIGIIILVLALVVLCTCLICIVKTLNSLLKGRISVIIKKFVNAEFPGKCSYFTGYLAIVIGTGLTILVQSSSVFTSALTPLVGIGVISVERMYPLTLGANIGTTTTAILAALAQSSEDIPKSLQISLCHLFFNLSGILIFFPIPYMRFPINMAKFLGNQTAKYRWFAILYLVIVFLLFPGAVFGLTIVSWVAMAAVFGPILLLLIIVAIVNVLQRKAPRRLPRVLRTWRFLPEVLRSLRPYDRVIQKVFVCCKFCKAKEVTENTEPSDDKSETKL